MITQSKRPKGATPLKLNNTELRRELNRADRIINIACQSLPTAQMAAIQLELLRNDITGYRDPLAQKSRQQAMHRITPKRDYLKFALIVLAIMSVLAWSCSQTENELLQGELAQHQPNPTLGDNHENRTL